MNFRLKKVMAPEGAAGTGGGDGAGNFLGEGAGAPGGNANGGSAGGQQGANQGGGSAGGAPQNPYPKEDWRHALPQELWNEESFKIINDVPTLAKNYIHTKKMIGADKVTLPSQHATDDDYQQFFDKLGRPKLEEYKPNLPKDAKYVAPEVVDKLKPIAHKAGIMPKQLEKVLEFYEQTQGEADAEFNKQVDQQIKDGMNGLRTKWGKTFDQRAAWAKKVVDEKGSPELKKFFQENRLASWNPHLIELLATFGETVYKEDSIKGGGQGGGSLLDPQQAMSKYNSILADATHPYNLGNHPNHANAVKEVDELFKMAYPEPA